MDIKDTIYQHLADMAKKDENFKKCFEDKAKNMDDCLNYILGQAKKEATHNAAVIEDSVVFGWAAHYYQEDQVKVDKDENIACAVNISQKIKRAKKKPVAMELDLFGGTI